jgi:acyl carrier protein
MLSEQSVKQVLAQLLDVDEARLTADSLLNSIDGWDSVNALRILIYLERENGASIDYDRFIKAERLGDLVTLTQGEGGTQASKRNSAP